VVADHGARRCAMRAGLCFICYLRFKQMKIFVYFLACVAVTAVLSCKPPHADLQKWKSTAAAITIIRDTWGIAHVYAKTDADAVFGWMYAQCEENFEKIERAYLQKMGRIAELDGASVLYDDLLMRQLYDTALAKKEYAGAAPWMKALLQAFADGVNYYLALHPGTARLLKHFEPWFPLIYSDGAYISTAMGGLEARDIAAMYNLNVETSQRSSRISSLEETGSNGFAVAPARTANGSALLYINPHVPFYFRTEGHISSDEGLNAYGAVTWGQFFVFQGFNERCGWMHTSSAADAADLYEEEVQTVDGRLVYRYENNWRPVLQKKLQLKFAGVQPSIKELTVYATHHGPVVGKRGDKWLSLRTRNHSLKGLMQSWLRMKATTLEQFEKVLDMRANHSTNTVYADADGNIAYWHGNFIPQRAAAMDFSQPVNGTIAATEWTSEHAVNELVHIKNPASGWIQNCNSSPFSVAGWNSLPKENYPSYMAPEGDNFRSAYAIKRLQHAKLWTIDSLAALGMDNYLSCFDTLLPYLFSAYDTERMFFAGSETAEAIDLLKKWDRRPGIESAAFTLASQWTYNVLSEVVPGEHKTSSDLELFSHKIKMMGPRRRLQSLQDVQAQLKQAFGTWKIAWGELNRFQRPEKENYFDDAQASVPVARASALFGCLPAYESRWKNTRKGYGVTGNSFAAVVEFGKTLNAIAIVPGGHMYQSTSPHFTDQSELYVEGKWRKVWFYRKDIIQNKEREYHPGEE
jgi:acyl-homoserine-lactone acylase